MQKSKERKQTVLCSCNIDEPLESPEWPDVQEGVLISTHVFVKYSDQFISDDFGLCQVDTKLSSTAICIIFQSRYSVCHLTHSTCETPLELSDWDIGVSNSIFLSACFYLFIKFSFQNPNYSHYFIQMYICIFLASTEVFIAFFLWSNEVLGIVFFKFLELS